MLPKVLALLTTTCFVIPLVVIGALISAFVIRIYSVPFICTGFAASVIHEHLVFVTNMIAFTIIFTDLFPRFNTATALILNIPLLAHFTFVSISSKNVINGNNKETHHYYAHYTVISAARLTRTFRQ